MYLKKYFDLRLNYSEKRYLNNVRVYYCFFNKNIIRFANLFNTIENEFVYSLPDIFLGIIRSFNTATHINVYGGIYL